MSIDIEGGHTGWSRYMELEGQTQWMRYDFPVPAVPDTIILIGGGSMAM